MKTLQEILAHTEKDGDCMVWTRCLNTDGYPRMGVKGNANIKVHRLVCELHTGEDITGLVVRHKCDNPRCINPDHLEIGDLNDNVQDRNKRARTHGHVSEREQKAIVALREAGFTYKQIAEQLGIKYKRVEWVLAEKHRRNRGR